MRRFVSFGLVLVASACTGSTTPVTPTADASADKSTATCATPQCIGGTVNADAFTVPFATAKVELYAVFPYGTSMPVSVATVAADKKYAFQDVTAPARYYLKATVRFGSGSSAYAVASVAGPFDAPASSIDLTVRPVFLEVLQQRSAGAAGAVTWASAHVFDAGSGREVDDAKVAFHAGAQTFAMPFIVNVGGAKSYYVQVDKGTPAAAAFTIDVVHQSFAAPATFHLTGEIPTFDGRVQSPAEGAKIAVGQPLVVAWMPELRAAYTLVQLFHGAGSSFASKYTSPAPLGVDVSKETIPAASIDAAGTYLLNVQFSKPTCPLSADGCVYNASTSIINVDAT